MVYSLATKGVGVERYAETDWDVLDMPVEAIPTCVEYADPASVHPSALGEHVARMEQGYWMKSDTLPSKVLWASGERPIPDVLPRFTVSPRFRDLVEAFEPSVHQFVPVEVFKKRTGTPVATYYWFIVGQLIDSVNRERSTFQWEEGQRGLWVDELMNTTTWEFTKIPNARLVFSRSRIGSRHIWRDMHVLGGERLCSTAFGEAALAARLTGVSISPREEA